MINESTAREQWARLKSNTAWWDAAAAAFRERGWWYADAAVPDVAQLQHAADDLFEYALRAVIGGAERSVQASGRLAVRVTASDVELRCEAFERTGCKHCDIDDAEMCFGRVYRADGETCDCMCHRQGAMGDGGES